MAFFLKVAELAEEMAATQSRLKKRAGIAQAIRAVHDAAPESEDSGLFALYLAGTPFAESDSRKLNVGGALLTRAVLAISSASEAELAAAYRRNGDLGAAAFDLLGHLPSRSAELTLAELASTFAALAAARTTAARSSAVEALLRRATPLEAKYLIKLMLGDMRIGVQQSLVEEAIAAAAEVPVAAVRHAVMLEADLGSAVRRAFAGTLGEARMRLFHPLGFMLASPVDSPEEAVERFRSGSAEAAAVEAFLEDKYDGMRAQVHCGDAEQPGRVAIYSRNREDITESYPELAEAFGQIRPEQQGGMILDGEVLGWDFDPGDRGDGGRAFPFAVLSQRIGRKRVGNELRSRVPVVFMAFDLLYAAGGLTLGLPLRERRRRLEAMVQSLQSRVAAPLEAKPPEPPQALLFAASAGTEEAAPALPRLLLSPATLVESAENIELAYRAARARANEGVMLKAADSIYQPGRRGLAWVKLKRELATLDVVITGAEYGHGKRAGLLSDYTFAVRGPQFATTGELLNVGKAYSGVTDAEIAQLTEFLKQHTLEDFGHFRTVEPLIVLEVAFNNVMRSDRHSSGFALRFPRIFRLRPDKPVEEIDTLARVEEIYQSQVDKPADS